MSVYYNGSYYYYALNLQGDVVAILNNSGAAVVQYTYDAWGRHLSISGSMAPNLGQLNPFRYRGYIYDSETGLYYVSSRYYDPEIGRWMIRGKKNVNVEWHLVSMAYNILKLHHKIQSGQLGTHLFVPKAA